MREAVGKREVAQERALDFVLPREEMLGRTRKAAVAEPARALAARAVREDVDGVLRKGLAGGLEDPAVRRILQRAGPRRVAFGFLYVRISSLSTVASPSSMITSANLKV